MRFIKGQIGKFTSFFLVIIITTCDNGNNISIILIIPHTILTFIVPFLKQLYHPPQQYYSDGNEATFKGTNLNVVQAGTFQPASDDSNYINANGT